MPATDGQLHDMTTIMQAVRTRLNDAHEELELALKNVQTAAGRLASLEKNVQTAAGRLASLEKTAESWLGPSVQPVVNQLDALANGFGYYTPRIFSDTFKNLSQWYVGMWSGAGGPWPDAALSSVSPTYGGNVSLQGDGCHLSARWDAAQGSGSGAVMCSWGHFALKSGLVLAKLKMPPGMGAGYWPAFWFLPGVSVPQDVNEIDVMEGGMLPLSGAADESVMAHYHIGPANRTQQVFAFNAGKDLTADFHIFGMELLPGTTIRLSIDGQVYARITQSVTTIPVEIIFDNVIAGSSTDGWHTATGPSTPQNGDLVVAEVAAWGTAA